MADVGDKIARYVKLGFMDDRVALMRNPHANLSVDLFGRSADRDVLVVESQWVADPASATRSVDPELAAALDDIRMQFDFCGTTAAKMNALRSSSTGPRHSAATADFPQRLGYTRIPSR